MKIVVQQNLRGIALIVVMIAVFVLSVLAGAFAYSMKVETKLAANASHQADLEWLGRSGVERARWILAQQLSLAREPYDALNQKWAGGPGSLASSNSPLADISLTDYEIRNQETGELMGKISLTITDLERKVNINMADLDTLQQALRVMGADANDIPSIADSILDWKDRDDSPHLNGAESDYYESLNPSYSAKNGALDDVSELLLIKGIRDNPSIYSSDYASAAFQRRDRFGDVIESPNYSAHLVDVFTAISMGRININTATNTVLQMIPGVDAETASQIIRVRAGPDGADGTDDDTPFETVAQLATVSPYLQQQQRYCTVRSSTFEVEVDAQIGGSKQTFYAIIGRNNQRDVQVLSFYWK